MMNNRKMEFIILSFLGAQLCGCNGLLPGMQGINTYNVPKYQVPQEFPIQPTIICINAALFANHPPPPYIYHIAPQDILSINVWEHPEFNSPIQATSTFSTQSSQAAGIAGYLVNQKGKIYFPLIGYISVAGKTIDQVQTILTEQLREYIRNPQINVRVADYRSKKIYVLGEIIKPQLLPLNDQPLSITDALTLSGSIDANAADPRHIYVLRGNLYHPTIYWLDAKRPDALLLAEHFQLQPNDIIYVSSAVTTRWNRFLNQLLPTLQTIWYTKAITSPALNN